MPILNHMTKQLNYLKSLYLKNTQSFFSDGQFAVLFIFDYIGDLSLIFWYVVNIYEAYNVVDIWCQEG